MSIFPGLVQVTGLVKRASPSPRIPRSLRTPPGAVHSAEEDNQWGGLVFGEEQGRCFTIEYVMPASAQLTSESTVSVLKMIRSATPFPLVSLFFMFIGFILSNIGHVRPHRTILAFVSGIFFILSGAAFSRSPEAPSTSALRLLPQSAGVMSVYLFMKRYTAEDLYRPHPGFYRPRLSNCSDYSGQFLHPDAWARGRSPSDLSSDASLQMNSSYPALLKCPDYDQMSTSPC
ncbi:PREDICTED: voltage-dependent calcium channel gamma-5 subunit [Bison bison bison]|uniref:Voltage-dependent calcium channel gamma-5 subunit n=1 Tax=Bison bison bison TaxID=43346 RepID=A0A6P3IUC5_BISBB|nr:PREDICTED: voltage-dependent calcium channel gamma-5 subunit [Bison bison bison]